MKTKTWLSQMIGTFRPPEDESLLRSLLIFIISAGTYFLFAKLGLTLATLSHSASPVWPATGIAIALVAYFKNRSLLAIAVGAFAANSLTGGSLASTIAISIGNTLEAWVGALILQLLLNKRKQLSHHTEAIAYITSSAFASMVSATIGVTALFLSGSLASEAIVPVWFTWWIGDSLGGLVITPLALQILKSRIGRFNPANALSLVTLTALAIYFVFYRPEGSGFVFLLFPILLYAALKLGQFSILVSAAGICAMSVFATVSAQGPFAHGTLNERLVHLQFFLAAFAATALTLSSIGKRKLSRVACIVLVAGWMLAGGIFHSFAKSENEKAEAHVASLVKDSQNKISGLFSNYEEILRGGVALFSGSASVDQHEWLSYNNQLNIVKYHPGLNGLGVVWPVEPQELKKFEIDQRNLTPQFKVKSLPGFEITMNDLDRTRYVIKYLEPVSLNASAVGLDMSSEPHRRAAVENSRDTGLSTLTSQITLVQDKARTPGVIFFRPIYKLNTDLSSVEKRRAALLGWVFAPIIYHHFFAEVLRVTDDQLELQVFEGQSSTKNNIVFSNFSDEQAGKNVAREVQIQLGQKDFVIRWAKSASFVSTHNTIVAWVGFCGAIATLLITNLIVSMQLLGRRSREIADELTLELSSSREKFAQGERRLLYALDGSNDGIWDWNIEKSEMYLSGRIAETHGWPHISRVKSIKDLKDYTHPDDVEAVHASITSALSGLIAAHEVETRYRTVTGAWRWVLTRGKISERDEDGRPIRMTGVHIDIHELKKTQHLLQEKEYQLGNIANSVPTIVTLLDNELNCVFANELFGQWFGLKASDIIGKKLSEILGEGYFESRRPLFQRALEGETIRYEREVVRRCDFEKRYIMATYLPNIRNGERNGFFMFIQDVTDLKHAEIQAHEERKAAVEATNVKSQFLATMSHEIRTPLNGIIGMTNLLKQSRLDPKQKDYSEVIGRSSEALLNLINDILDFSKVEAGKLELDVVDFSLKHLVSDLIYTFSFAAQEKNLELKADIQLEGHEYYKGDPGRIRQILTNLIGNAVKFTSKGSVTLRIRSFHRGPAPEILFEILDTGVGIPQDSIPRLFQAFSQADSSTTRRFGGTGLGLSICKQLVVLMGGEIGVNSIESQGSEFWFRVQLPVGENLKIIKNPSVLERTLNARILIVEDNLVNQRIALETLKNLGYLAQAVGNGREAIETLGHAEYDLVLMDCQMPEMDGFEATEHIRANGKSSFQNIPIIAMTANAFNGDRERCLKAGMDDYVVKPIDQNKLIAAIEDCLGASRPVEKNVENRSPSHILVVEDNKVNQSVIKLYLAKLNYTFDVVDNGLLGVQYLSTKNCNLILMDCQMPEMDGYEATRQIRALTDAQKSSLPIVALTANALKGDREKCLDAGMDDYLPKPVVFADLKATMERWLNQKFDSTAGVQVPRPKTGESQIILPAAIESIRSLQKLDEPTLLVDLINLFTTSAAEGLSELETAAEAHDLSRVAAIAHNLKSSALNLGAHQFAEICSLLERAKSLETDPLALRELRLKLNIQYDMAVKELAIFKTAG